LKTLIALFALVALFVAPAVAADITGTWKGTAETPNGPIERMFVFKQSGTALTGESSSELMGKSTIENGKVEGDAISFTLTVKFQDNEFKVNYSGKLEGDTIKLKLASEAFSADYVLKKAS
jgi:hypothetical protein